MLKVAATAVKTEIKSIFSKVRQNTDTTKIIIAQRISSIEHADKIIVMDGGQIESIGNHSELLEKSPIYREVYNSQNKGDEQK